MPEWADTELTDSIKLRQFFNRKYRNAVGDEKDVWKKKYMDQKLITKMHTRNKKGGWEKRKVLEAKESNGQTMWKIVKEKAGKTEPKDNECFIYNEDEEKSNIIEVWKDFISSWKQNVYQKDDCDILSIWYGRGGNRLER